MRCIGGRHSLRMQTNFRDGLNFFPPHTIIGHNHEKVPPLNCTNKNKVSKWPYKAKERKRDESILGCHNVASGGPSVVLVEASQKTNICVKNDVNQHYWHWISLDWGKRSICDIFIYWLFLVSQCFCTIFYWFCRADVMPELHKHITDSCLFYYLSFIQVCYHYFRIESTAIFSQYNDK